MRGGILSFSPAVVTSYSCGLVQVVKLSKPGFHMTAAPQGGLGTLLCEAEPTVS